MNIVEHELLHGVVGLLIGLFLARARSTTRVFSSVIVATFLLDLDHLLDYLLTIGPHWDAAALATGSYFAASGRVIVLLHSWELAALLTWLGLRSQARSSDMLLGLGVGMIGHLMVDQIAYHQPSLFTYLLSVRLLHGFVDPILW